MDGEKLPLLDADILAYESCYAGQYFDEGRKEVVVLGFRNVQEKIDLRVQDIMDTLETRLEPIMYLTGPDNFRDAIATKKGYKANRDKTKRPFHLANARAYITARYNTFVSKGCEADDLLCVSLTKNRKELAEGKTKAVAVLCSRDKDLRQCEGWHYGWESGFQAEFDLQYIDKVGYLTPKYKDFTSKKTRKVTQRIVDLKGGGDKFLYAQMLMGDGTDNIPGLPGMGPSKVFKLIDPLKTEQEMLDAVIGVYKQKYGTSETGGVKRWDWWEELFEQARLVYMIRELNPDNTLKHWDIPEGCDVNKHF